MNTDVSSLLPTVLRNMMGQLLNNYNVQGWNIFPNKREQICLTIRFDTGAGGHVDSVARSDSVVYRKVSPRQQTRAKLRLDKHKAINPTTAKENHDNHLQECSSDTKPTLPNKKRKYDNVTPELCRIPSLTYTDSNTIESPESVVVNDCYEDTSAQIMDSPEALTWVKQPVCNRNQLSISTEVEPVEHAESSPLVSPLPDAKFFHSPIDSLPELIPHHSSPKSPLPPTHDQADDTIRCPCCNEKMTLTHECADSNDINELHSISNTSNNDLICTPTSVPSQPPIISPDPSPQRPDAAPSHNGSMERPEAAPPHTGSTNQTDPPINIDNNVWLAIAALLLDRQAMSERKTE